MLTSNPILTVCILVKDYYDIECIEKIKYFISKMPHFRFFISPQYTKEPRYDIYVVSNIPQYMIDEITSNKDIMKYIDDISVSKI